MGATGELTPGASGMASAHEAHVHDWLKCTAHGRGQEMELNASRKVSVSHRVEVMPLRCNLCSHGFINLWAAGLLLCVCVCECHFSTF